VNFPTCNRYTVSVPITLTIQLTPSNNEDYLVVMLPNSDQWDFWNITKPGQTAYNPGDWGGSGSCSANGNWQAVEALQHSPGWTSGGTMTGGGSESGTFEGHGAIRLLDTQQTPTGGNWGHALGWTGFDNCASATPAGSRGTSPRQPKATAATATPAASRWAPAGNSIPRSTATPGPRWPTRPNG
jgi:hypothetical protein